MIKRITILLAVIFSVAVTQDAYVSVDNQVYEWLDYLEVKGVFKTPLSPERPLLRSDILKYLDSVDISKLSSSENRILRHFKSILDYPRRDYRGELSSPFSSMSGFKKGLSQLWSYDPGREELHLLTFTDSNIVLSSDWAEQIRWENRIEGNRRIESDGLMFSGEWRDNFLFGSEIIRFREYDSLSVPPEEFKQPIRKAQMGGDFVNWDETHGYLLWRNDNLRLGFTRIPLIWGNSGERSMFLSANSAAFANLSAKVQYGKFDLFFYHAELLSQADSVEIATGFSYREKKYLAAHCITFSPSAGLQLSVTEAVVYSRESPEISYFLPLLWYKQLEHNLGDRDNLLIYLQGTYLFAGLGEIYGAVLLDEFAISKITKNWWANKQGYQAGLKFYWKAGYLLNLVHLQGTIIRPWVYSHERNATTYTHAGIGLGFPNGPNTSTLYLSNMTWITERFQLQTEVENLIRGLPEDETPIGSDPNDIYTFRDKSKDESTGWLMGKLHKQTRLTIGVRYKFSNTFTVLIKSNLGIWSKSPLNNGIHSFKVSFDY